MNALVVSTALRPGSHTLTAARIVQWRLETDGFAVDLADLASGQLPQPEAAGSLPDKTVREMVGRVKRAALVVICFPVSGNQPNYPAQDFVKITNEAWKGKVVSFVASATDDCSYLASLPLANSLMVDHQCLVVPHFLQLVPAACDSAGAMVLEGAAATLFEQQMRSAAHLARTWPGRNRSTFDLNPSRLSRPRMGWSLS
jgi:NAD(P)H-dependent FMN reductase